MLLCAILAGATGAAEARALRKKSHRRTPAAAVAPADAARASPRKASHGPARRKPKGARRAAVVSEEPVAAPTDLIPRRLLIVGFAGRGSLTVRGAAIGVLKTVPSLRLAPLKPSEALRIGTMYSAEKTRELAQRLNLTAVLYGEVTEARRNFRVNLILANGEDGQTVGTIFFEGRSLAAARTKMRAQLWANLGPLIDLAASPGPPEVASDNVGKENVAAPPPAVPEAPERAAAAGKAEGKTGGKTGDKTGGNTGGKTSKRPPDAIASGEPSGARKELPAAPEPEPAAPSSPGTAPGDETPEGRPTPLPSTVRRPPQDEDEGIAAGPPAPRARRHCALAEVQPAGGVMVRRFNYRDEQRGALRGYSLYRAPSGGVEGTIYPFANEACGLTARLGLRLGYERMAPVISTLADRRLGTQASAYQAELSLRLERGALTVQPAVGYFVRQYSVDDDVVPRAAYRAIGASVDAGLRIAFVTIELGAGVRRLLGTGVLDSADWFPGLSSFAASGRGRIGVAVNEWIDILAGGSLEYYSFDFKIDPNGPYPNGVASGAYDVYLQGLVSARFRLGLRGRATADAP